MSAVVESNHRIQRIQESLEEIQKLWDATETMEQTHRQSLEEVAPGARESARNLVHYLAIRQQDLRQLQVRLSELGLSSLGRLEAHVRATLVEVRRALLALLGEGKEAEPLPAEELGFARGDQLLAEHADQAFGAVLAPDLTRIMVTMPTDAAHDGELVRRLMENGMTVARINCAHDGPEIWEKIFLNIHEARVALGRDCRVAFDLAGPKLRTGPTVPEPVVRKWKPERDAYGRVTERSRIFLTTPEFADTEFEPGLLPLPVGSEFFSLIRAGYRVVFKDTRDRHRRLDIEEVTNHYAIARTDRTSYAAPGTRLHLFDKEGDRFPETGEVVAFSSPPSAIDLVPGQRLRVDRGTEPGRSRVLDESGNEIEPARISCDLETVFQDAERAQPIAFDDGKIEGVIEEAHENHLIVRVTRMPRLPTKLKPEKGINLPETRLRIPGLTTKDIEDLDFVFRFGNLVSFSFVRNTSDIDHLVSELNQRGADELGIILKIETREGFENLASLLLTAMQHPPVAVMIARGDLGVELGFERMAEVQEEILWLCEAAHVPVIWATQVLESLAKRGLATRGDITDAAMSSRAECVMLNKGPHILETVSTLGNILRRMASHQSKKTATLRRLKIAFPDRASGDHVAEA